MTLLAKYKLFNDSSYLFGSRILTHGIFWVMYYVAFSLIWAKPETGLFASFYLEFLLLPARILSVYCVMYFLIPKYLLTKKFSVFLVYYLVLLGFSAGIQSLVGVFFYDALLLGKEINSPTLSHWLKNLMLINTTVVFLGALTILKRYFQLQGSVQSSEQKKLEVIAQRRTYLIDTNTITYVQGLGNYVEIYFEDGNKLTTYSSIKAMKEKLSNEFVRVHKSYIINRRYLESFNANDIVVKGVTLPRSNDCEDKWLLAS